MFIITFPPLFLAFLVLSIVYVVIWCIAESLAFRCAMCQVLHQVPFSTVLFLSFCLDRPERLASNGNKNTEAL
ncbi:hypothetical protein F5146DRAFT_1042897 [Armillaria mellea]|nr:hypothetical protein F5146DRAFT_1042897 [Armillaria mellea]